MGKWRKCSSTSQQKCKEKLFISKRGRYHLSMRPWSKVIENLKPQGGWDHKGFTLSTEISCEVCGKTARVPLKPNRKDKWRSTHMCACGYTCVLQILEYDPPKEYLRIGEIPLWVETVGCSLLHESLEYETPWEGSFRGEVVRLPFKGGQRADSDYVVSVRGVWYPD